MQYLGIIGAIALGISPFFRWESLVMKGIAQETDYGCSLYQLAKADKANNTHFMILVALVLAAAAVLLFIALIDMVPYLDFKLGKIKAIEYIRLGAVLVAIAVWLLAFYSKSIRTDVAWYKELIENYSSVYSNMKGHGNRGIGPVICMGGIVLQIPYVYKTFIKVCKEGIAQIMQRIGR